MIHIFSSEFTVDKLDEVALTILIEDRCRLSLHTIEKGKYYFTGESEGWLTTVPILKQDADNLNIEEYTLLDDYKPTNSSLVEVAFYNVISRLLSKSTFMTYFEVDLSSLQTSATRVWIENDNEFTCTTEDDLFDAVWNAQ
jgi:hypothetical protein